MSSVLVRKQEWRRQTEFHIFKSISVVRSIFVISYAIIAMLINVVYFREFGIYTFIGNIIE